ncbi:MAG: NAD-dependent epimerase/dehydratase family protein [Ancrocorticia sp.]|jgi:UDP-glucose 4-epimerase|nr:NAD-dependent epimerase/dehydratase family protein [Ancrocorticia sp.]MCI2003029.1 NAD-dependent epimerase/dehydratase family protein [Ancrocorticia sp.]
MKAVLVGGGGFVGINLALRLAGNMENSVYVVSRHFSRISNLSAHENISQIPAELLQFSKYRHALKDADVVFHLASSIIPGRSNIDIPNELTDISASAALFEKCIESGVKRLVFLSSGGAIYGSNAEHPTECSQTFPISSYGIQKLAIERLLYLYSYTHHLDYRIVRLSNPYGPYQDPNRGLGVISTFIYDAVNNKDLTVLGDGSVVRDFIYIDDAIDGILAISEYDGNHRIFNLGTGHGISIRKVAELVVNHTQTDSVVRYRDGRTVDVPRNVLDTSLIRRETGFVPKTSLGRGIELTAEFFRKISKAGYGGESK